MRCNIAIPLLFCFLIGSGVRSVAAEAWTTSLTNTGDFVATVAVDHVSSRVPSAIALLNIAFNPRTRCRAELGMAIVKGSGYGDPIGRANPSETDIASIQVDDNPVWTVHPFLVKYTNGWEVLFSISPAILDQLEAGRVAYGKIIPAAPSIAFPLRGGQAAIENVRLRCQSAQR